MTMMEQRRMRGRRRVNGNNSDSLDSTLHSAPRRISSLTSSSSSSDDDDDDYFGGTDINKEIIVSMTTTTCRHRHAKTTTGLDGTDHTSTASTTTSENDRDCVTSNDSTAISRNEIPLFPSDTFLNVLSARQKVVWDDGEKDELDDINSFSDNNDDNDDDDDDDDDEQSLLFLDDDNDDPSGEGLLQSDSDESIENEREPPISSSSKKVRRSKQQQQQQQQSLHDSQVSFSSHLTEVIDIPNLSPDAKERCFYSGDELYEFRTEYEFELEGLLPTSPDEQ